MLNLYVFVEYKIGQGLCKLSILSFSCSIKKINKKTMIFEIQAENRTTGKRVKCDWSDNVIIPTIHEFKETSDNISRILNPKAKSINQKKAEKILEEIYGN